MRGVQGVQELGSVYVPKPPLLEFHFRYRKIVWLSSVRRLVVRGVPGVQGVQESDSVYVSKPPLLEFHFRYRQIVS